MDYTEWFAQSPSIGMGAYGHDATQYYTPPPPPQVDPPPTTPQGGGGTVNPIPSPGVSPQIDMMGMGAFDYYNQGLAQLLAQMQGQYMSNDQFYANLDFQKSQADKLADQWAKDFGWSKEQAIAAMLMAQQQTTGYIQTNPYLTGGGAGYPGGGFANDPYSAIWSQRSDLKGFYDSNWGAGTYDPADAVRNWLGMTHEQSVIDANRDAATFAQNMGWYDPSGDYQAQFPEGSWQNSLERDIAEWNRELSQEQLGLNYLGLLGQMRGPQDWLAYARTVRGAEGTGLPTWAEALQNRSALPAFGAAYQADQLDPIYSQLPSWGQNMMAHQIHPAQWNAMTPAEQQMLMGAVEEGGGWGPDFVQQMSNAWPTLNRATPTSYWG